MAEGGAEKRKLFQNSNDEFTSRFQEEVLKNNPNKNVIMSAYSVLLPLAQLSFAASGTTKSEILEAIYFKDIKKIRATFTFAIQQAEALSGVTLKLANRLFLAIDAKVSSKFISMSKTIFKSEVQNLNFKRQEGAASTINKWVETQTNGKIKNIIDPDTITAATRLVLVNSIYFKGAWLKPFLKDTTRDRPFHSSADKVVMVPTMQTIISCKYGESNELKSKLLELHYKNRETSFLIVLPNKVDGLSELMMKLKDPKVLSRSVVKMNVAEVNLTLPKFKIETTTDLKNILQNMGVKNLFMPTADLKHLLSDGSKIYIQQAVQKAFIEINENGTEAAAANAFKAVKLASKLVQHHVEVNKPFYYEIRQDVNPIFTGVARDFVKTRSSKTPISRDCGVWEFLYKFIENENCNLNIKIEV